MAVIVKFSTVSTPNPITDYLPAADTVYFLNQPNTLINPDVSTVIDQPIKYWKHVAGVIQLMSVGEQATVDAAEAANLLNGQRAEAKGIVDSLDGTGKLQRAVADIIKDELNILRQWDESFKAQVALSISLADLKTRVATLPSLPDRTLAQLRTSIKNRIDSGSVDA